VSENNNRREAAPKHQTTTYGVTDGGVPYVSVAFRSALNPDVSHTLVRRLDDAPTPEGQGDE
jgi:hypothetical protein